MSLHLRLAFWYSALTAIIVLFVGLVGYTIHSRAHYDHLDMALMSAAEHIAGASSQPHGDAELEDMLRTPILPNVAMRVYEGAGRLVAQSDNAAIAPEVDPRTVIAHPVGSAFSGLSVFAPPFNIVPPGEGAFGLVTDAHGERWRLYVLPLHKGAEYVVGTASLAQIDQSVQTFRQLVPLLVVMGAVIMFVASQLLAGQALRPVTILTETAKTIAHSRSFGQRVPVGTTGDELGRLAVTFNEMLDSLEQAYQAQQRFVSDASHELRAPLTAIQGNLELLHRQRPIMSDAEQAEAIGEAEREARRLGHLVADLLALARADAGVQVRRQSVELDRVVMEALSEARHLARGQRLTIDRLEPITLMGDEDRLKQLCLILLDNALKYTPASGQVGVSLSQTDGRVILQVQDTGVGIPAGDLPHVFDRFYRADPARSRDPGGTGLGLAIGKWIVEQHGGEIALASQSGIGTTVTVLLPALSPASLASTR